MTGPLFDAMARGIVGPAAAATLLLAVAALLAPRPALAVRLVVAQAACLALVLLAQAGLQASWWLVAVAGFTVVAKAVALPLGVRALVPVMAETTGRLVSGPAAAAVALAGLAVVAMAPAAGSGAAIALAVMLVGGFALIRGDTGALGPVIGVLVMENGLVLALATAPGLAGMALLALATAALPAAALLVLVQRLLPGRAGG